MKNLIQSSSRSLWLAAGALLICGPLLILSGIYLHLAPQLPDVESLKHFQFETPLKVLSADGHLIAEYGDKHTTPLTYDHIPPLFIKALLAAEDDRFFVHQGIDIRGLGRAFVDLARTGSIQSGGSTLTMQVAKNYFLSRERTFSRKFTEILLAREIEQSLSKQEILTLYVNKIFLGHRAYGIAAAAQVYFGKDIHELGIADLAMIAGLPKAPSRYNPVDDAPRALQRRNWIITRMRDLGYISTVQASNALKAPLGLNFQGTVSEVNGLYLAEMVRDTLVSRFGEDIYASGWKVYTTVSANRQNAANLAVRDGLLEYDRRHGWRGPEGRDKSLDDYYTIGGLKPAEVVTVHRDSIEAKLRDERTIIIPWKGISWARPYINTSSLGKTPASATDLVKTGDIIRVLETHDGWQLSQLPAVQGLLIALNPDTGAVEALVGGFDFFQSKYNRITQGGRQAGSTLKPFIYASALEKGFTPSSIINDAPLSFGSGPNAWTPENSDGDYMGPITLRRALYLSRNLVSIRLLQAVGIDPALAYLSKFGLPTAGMPHNLTLALGSANVLPIQMANAYSTLANGGYRINPFFIEKIEDAKGHVIFRANPVRVCRECELASTPVEPTQVSGSGTSLTVQSPPQPVTPASAPRMVSARTAYQIDSILRDVIIHGTGRGALAIGRSDVSGKTGTTNEAKDAWFAGFNPHLAAVVWVGFDDPAPLGAGEFGGVAAVPIWNRFMEAALANTPESFLPVPTGLTAVRINKTTGEATSSDDPEGYTEYLPSEKAPTTTPTPSTGTTTSEQGAAEQLF